MLLNVRGVTLISISLDQTLVPTVATIGHWCAVGGMLGNQHLLLIPGTHSTPALTPFPAPILNHDVFKASLYCKVRNVSVRTHALRSRAGIAGLTFDYRIMNRDSGYFFMPAVDLGVVYSSFHVIQTASVNK